jgi:hypothetical protein
LHLIAGSQGSALWLIIHEEYLKHDISASAGIYPQALKDPLMAQQLIPRSSSWVQCKEMQDARIQY